MAGYDRYSMSNNAVFAYENGEKPLSKWTKGDILTAIKAAVKDEELTLNCSLDTLKKVPAKELKDLALRRTSWHHTSSHYNRTDFYSLNYSKLESLTEEGLEKIIADSKASKSQKAEEPKDEIWRCAFLEWSGTRKHPKATEYIEEGTIKGDWFIRKDGSKKKTTAKGFRFIEKIQ